MPDHVTLNILSLVFQKSSFLNPSGYFPSFELDHNLSCIDCLDKIEVDVSGDGVSCEVEGLVELDES